MVLILIALVIISLTTHKYAHALIAQKLGDSTPLEANRLTPNPLKHIDIFGTLILPVLTLAATGANLSLGYARPVPINSYYFKNPKKGAILVSLAGPLAHVAIAIVSVLLMKLAVKTLAYDLFFRYAIINIGLAAFHLLPIPGLDGFRIAVSLLPYGTTHRRLKTGLAALIIIVTIAAMGLPDKFFSFLANVLILFSGIQ